MDTKFRRTLDRVRGNPGLNTIQRGLEKEALRIDRYGYLSQQPHPQSLGSALTHPSITTDFSEAQLEFITVPHTSIEACMFEMEELHRYVYQHLVNEILWPSSMPCMLKGEHAIPIARFGSSNLGRYKHIYRRGLANRYGKFMQTISGLHYNFSVSARLWKEFARIHDEENTVEFRSSSYLSLIRNCRRHAWLLLYLFGTSPAVCGSFVAGRPHKLQSEDSESYYRPYATSLRMGPLGYYSDVQTQHWISFNSLEEYINSMVKLLSTSWPTYEAIGQKGVDGEYQQLSTSILQIEAESYGTIRPKSRPKTGLRPIDALRQFGIEYIEVRCLDLNPFFPTGIERRTLYFLDAFLLWAWLYPSREDDASSWHETQANQLTTVLQGRDPNATVGVLGESHSLVELGHRIVEYVAEVAQILDEINNTTIYGESVAAQQAKLSDSSKTPSAQILRTMAEQDRSYYYTIDYLAKEHQQHFVHTPVTGELQSRLDDLSKTSVTQQADIEARDSESLDDYIRRSQVARDNHSE